MTEKRWYVELKRLDGKHIYGCSSYLVPWTTEGIHPLLYVLDELEVDKPVEIKFTMRKLTDDEFQDMKQERHDH